MKYTVKVNEKKRTVTVTLGQYKGTAKCCETDCFNLQTGIELALERAKNAQALAEKERAEKNAINNMSVTALVHALEKALPKGQMVVVGNGDHLTERQKAYLHSLSGYKDISKDELDTAYNKGYDDGHSAGYDEGYEDGYSEGEEGCDECCDECCECECDTNMSEEELAAAVRKCLASIFGIIID